MIADEFFTNLRGAASVEFGWVVLDPNLTPKGIEDPLSIEDEQIFLQKISEMAPEKDAVGARTARSAGASPARKAAGAKAGAAGAGGEDLKSNAADFFANLQGPKKPAKKVSSKPSSSTLCNPPISLSSEHSVCASFP